DAPGVEGAPYTMAKLDSRHVAAIFRMSDEEAKQGITAHWNCYVAVDDVDQMTQRAEKAGAKFLVPAFDIMDAGRTSIIQDPTGAVLALWQGKRHRGAELVNQPHTVCWNELYTNNVDRAVSFYSALFGWTAKAQAMGQGLTVTIFSNGDNQVAT